MVLRPRSPPSSPAPSAHRDVASGLDRDAAVAAPSPVPSIAPENPVSLNSTGADVPMRAFAISQIYTSLTGTTCAEGTAKVTRRDLPTPGVARSYQSNEPPRTGIRGGSALERSPMA